MIVRSNEWGRGSLHFVAFSRACGTALPFHVAIPMQTGRPMLPSVVPLRRQWLRHNSLFLPLLHPYSHIPLTATYLTLLPHYTSLRSPLPPSFTFVNVKNYIW